jgi:succinate dehydrogenase/fumarate reductase flavoprotein subunit
MAVKKTSASASWSEEFDLVVLGSGAGGFSAATTAAAKGLKVLVLENTDYVGGTTAYSAGTCWAPGNQFQPDPEVDRAEASKYLDILVGDKADRALRQAYVERGAEAIDFLATQGITFRHSATVVDYHSELPGATVGRAMEPNPFDGRKLTRENFRRVRRPVPEFTLFGGTLMLRRAEVNQLLRLKYGSVQAAITALKLGWRWMFDMLRYPRGTRLVMGNGLIAALFNKFLELGGEVRFAAQTRQLIVEKGAITGLEVEWNGRVERIRARAGVVLAGGGFASSPTWRRNYLPEPTAQYTRASEGAVGSSLELGLAAGAQLGDTSSDNAFWFPSSIGRRTDGSMAVFPHIWDRAKPGIIAVGPNGRRFTDETVSYHRFTRAMYSTGSVPCWLIFDASTLRRYGVGLVRPDASSFTIKRHLNEGYLVKSDSIAGLAAEIGVDAQALVESVEKSNGYAVTGVDTEFGKGVTAFGLQYGDPAHKPNPNLGTIVKGPFYAIKLLPTPLGTSLGLVTNTNAQVLDTKGKPITGLYAAGNDANSVMSSEYPGAGCQVGAGLIFGYLAAVDVAGKAKVDSTTSSTASSASETRAGFHAIAASKKLAGS